MRAHVSVHEPKAPIDSETPFSYSMEGQNPGDQLGSTIPYVWSPGWNSNQSIFKFQSEVDGDLLGQSSGARLFDVPSEPDFEMDKQFNYDVVDSEPAGNGGLQPFAVPDVFGSEELSFRSWPIAQRCGDAYVVLNPHDAELLSIREGGGVKSDSLPCTHAVILDSKVKPGLVGISVGLNGHDELPAGPIRFEVDEDFVPRRADEQGLIAKS